MKNFILQKKANPALGFRVFGRKHLSGLLLALFSVWAGGLSAQTVYRINNANSLINCKDECGQKEGQSWYGDSEVGFKWDDKSPKDAKITKVEIKFHMGVDDGWATKTGDKEIFFNKEHLGKVSTLVEIDCSYKERDVISYDITDKFLSLYKEGGENTFLLVAKGEKMGFSENRKVFGSEKPVGKGDAEGAFAVVTVHYLSAISKVEYPIRNYLNWEIHDPKADINHLVNCEDGCDINPYESRYGDGDRGVGFRWLDKAPKGTTISKIEVKFHMGVEAGWQTKTGDKQVYLNKDNIGMVSTKVPKDDCDYMERDVITYEIDGKFISSYMPGEHNKFMLFAKGEKIGFSEKPKVFGSQKPALKGDVEHGFGVVVVHYQTTDLALTKVSPVIKHSSLCRDASYEVDVTVINNGPGMAGTVDVQIDFPGAASFTGKIDVSDLPEGKEQTYRVVAKDFLTPSKVVKKGELKATLLLTDIDTDNNRAFTYIDVLPLPSGFDITPSSNFPGFPRVGDIYQPDYITYNKTYVYEIAPPVGYANSEFGTAWDGVFSLSINGGLVSPSQYKYFPPSGKDNAYFEFSLEESSLDAVIKFGYTVTDLKGKSGCDSTTTRYAIVMPMPKPAFEGNFVCEADELQFVNNSTIVHGDMTHRWDFGDNQGYSILNHPKYRYSAIDKYMVKLVVTSNIGFSDSVTLPVEVGVSPLADFNFKNQCGNNPFEFENISSITGELPLSYSWNFGNGQMSDVENPSIFYTKPGSYTVSLIVESDQGCRAMVEKAVFSYPAPSVDFSVPSLVCQGTSVSFNNNTTIAFSTWGSEWSFGEEERTFIKNPSYAFMSAGTKEVTLKVTTQYGCVVSVTKDIEVISGPVIDITYSDVCTNAPVVFNSNVYIPQGLNATYVWNIDGELYSAATPSVTFPIAGVKKASVSIAYSNGCKNTSSISVETGYRPEADFSVADIVCAGEPVGISNNTTIEFGSAQYTWSMGDGSVYTGVSSPNHMYSNTEPTEYTITLVSSSANGTCPDIVSKNILVGVVPVCDFDVNAVYLPGHRGYTFEAPQADADYKWYFGDGRTSSEASPVHQYQRDGKYSVRLIITTAEGCQCEKSLEHIVQNLSAGTILAENGFTVYPNPSSGLVYVGNVANTKVASIKVTDAIGATVYKNAFNTQSEEYVLDLNHVATGVYMVTVETAEGLQLIQRVIIAE